MIKPGTVKDEPVGVDDGMLEAGAIALAQAESMGGFIPGFSYFFFH